MQKKPKIWRFTKLVYNFLEYFNLSGMYNFSSIYLLKIGFVHFKQILELYFYYLGPQIHIMFIFTFSSVGMCRGWKDETVVGENIAHSITRKLFQTRIYAFLWKMKEHTN
jgi:hypothetical protein